MPKFTSRAMLAITSLAALSACLPEVNRVPTVGRPTSQQAQAQLDEEAAAKASFDKSDLSGCWRPVQLFPAQGGSGPGLSFTKTGENSYSFEDGSKTTITIDGDKATFVAGDKTEVGETQFTNAPYLLRRPKTDGNQQGYQWAGKTCPPSNS